MLLQGGACASTVAALQRLGVMLQVSHKLPFFHSVNAFTAFEGPAWTSRLKPAMQLRPRLSFTPLHVHYCHKNSCYVQRIALRQIGAFDCQLMSCWSKNQSDSGQDCYLHCDASVFVVATQCPST